MLLVLWLTKLFFWFPLSWRQSYCFNQRGGLKLAWMISCLLCKLIIRKKWIESFFNINQVHIRRCYKNLNKAFVTYIKFILLGDASELVYGVVAYLKLEFTDDTSVSWEHWEQSFVDLLEWRSWRLRSTAIFLTGRNFCSNCLVNDIRDKHVSCRKNVAPSLDIIGSFLETLFAWIFAFDSSIKMDSAERTN